MTITRKHQKIIETGGIILFILPFLLLVFYVHPYHDDYIIAEMIAESSSWAAYQQNVFMNWSGRFFATFIVSLTPAIKDYYWTYEYIILANMLLFWISLFLFSKKIMHKTGYPKYSLLLWIFLLTIIHSTILSPAEFYYWKASSLAYLLPYSTGLLTISMLISNRISYVYWILGFILAIATSASNELVTAGWGIFIFLYLLSKFKFSKLRSFDIYIAIISLVTAIIFIAAPGNYQRLELLPHNLDPGGSLLNGTILTSKILATLMQSPTVIIGSILLLIYFPVKQKLIINRIPLWLVLTAGLIILLLSGSLPWYILGSNPAWRMINIVQLFMIFIWLIVIIRLKTSLSTKKLETSPNGVINMLLIAGFFILTLTDLTYKQKEGTDIRFRNNIPQAIYDLGTKAREYDLQMKHRHKKLLQSAGDSVVKLKPIKSKPETIFINDITNDPDNELNQAIARHYEIDKLILSENHRE